MHIQALRILPSDLAKNIWRFSSILWISSLALVFHKLEQTKGFLIIQKCAPESTGFNSTSSYFCDTQKIDDQLQTSVFRVLICITHCSKNILVIWLNEYFWFHLDHSSMVLHPIHCLSWELLCHCFFDFGFQLFVYLAMWLLTLIQKLHLQESSLNVREECVRISIFLSCCLVTFYMSDFLFYVLFHCNFSLEANCLLLLQILLMIQKLSMLKARNYHQYS